MRLLAILVLCLGLMGASDARAPVVPVTGEAAFWIGFTDGTCSATAIGPDLILSASHCFDGGPLVKINGLPAVQVGEVIHDGSDHAIIRVTRKFPRWALIGGGLYQGQEVSFYGNPAGLSHIFRRGYVMGQEGGWFLIDAIVNRGDSGSGIFDKRGRLVSVVSTLYVQGVAFHCMGAKPLVFTREQLASVGL
jgi:hypothetical protein